MGRNFTEKENSNSGKYSAGMSLYATLTEYGAGDYYPYHMPGHKRSSTAGEMARYYGLDITEIDGFDDLHHAEGILMEAQRRANRLYGAGETFYLVNGSTCGVLASIMACTGRGGELLIARNCHKSVYHAAIMQELTLRYCLPSIIEEYGICDGVDAQEIERLLAEYPDCRAVVITSPTYEGIVSDVKAIADAVHEKDKILIVDEAHGAHFGLDEGMPCSAVACGADLVVHSLHKTLPSMTQTALLHVQGERVDRRILRKYLTMLQTSSPSYVMMASMDCCVRYVEKYGAERFAFMRRQYEVFCKKTEACRHIRIGKMTDLSENGYQLTDWDIGKLVISVRHTSLNGRKLYDILRNKYHLQMEMAASDYVIAIMTIIDSEEGWQRLADALLEIDDSIEEESIGSVDAAKSIPSVEAVTGTMKLTTTATMTAAQAFHSDREEIPLENAVGRTAADFVNLYPPGVPILVPGEVISDTIYMRIREYLRTGLNVQGISSGGKMPVVLRNI